MSVAPPRRGRVRRRPAWLPALAALFFAGLTFWLGQWQLGRAEEKRARQAAFDAAATLPAVELAALPVLLANPPPLFSRIRVTGQYVSAYQIYLDNRPHAGRPGYHVVVPLAYPGGAVLVNRGWLAAASDRAIRPEAPPPATPVTLEGWLVPAQSRYLELSGHGVEGPVWQNLSLARYRDWYRADLPDRVLLQTSAARDGLSRDWPRPDFGIERHRGYAAQWFTMSAAICALYAYYGVWRRFHAPR